MPQIFLAYKFSAFRPWTIGLVEWLWDFFLLSSHGTEDIPPS